MAPMDDKRPFPVVIWFMGISGAGKSTLASHLRRHLEARGLKHSLIDGDEARAFFDHDLGYSKLERVANIKRILFAAYMLSQSGVAALVANISPFEELRQLARRKIPGYNEIYLEKSLALSMQEDVRKIYQNQAQKTDLVGIDIPFEKPLHSDLTLEVDRETPEQSFCAVLNYLRTKYPRSGL
jgi:adenylylsulfate kinase-like enzyme